LRLLLVLLLLVWHPASFALTAASALATLNVRGLPLALLLVARLAVTGIGVAAGILLFGRRPGSIRVAQVALAASVLMDLTIYLTPYFPNNRMPGDTPFYAAGTLAYHGAWIVFLRFSARVRSWEDSV
jgi:hypothetical protein